MHHDQAGKGLSRPSADCAHLGARTARSLLALPLLLLLGPLAARAEVIRVPEDRPTLPAALLVATPGDTISMADGNYDFTSTIVLTTPDLLITSRSPRGAVLRDLSFGQKFFDVRGDGIRLESLTLVAGVAEAVGIASSADATRVRDNLCYFLLYTTGIYDRGVGTIIEGNSIEESFLTAVLQGTGGTFRNNHVAASGPTVITRGAVVEGNEFVHCHGTGDASSSNGAGVIVSDAAGTVFLRDNRFEACSVDGPWEPTGRGGAVFAANAGDLRIERNEFMGNQAKSGAAVYAENSHLTIEQNHFIANRDSLSGSDNEVHGQGAGVYLLNVTGSVKSNTFHRNRSVLGGASIYMTGACDLEVSNNLMTENVSDVAGGVMAEALSGTSTFECNDAWSNEGANYAGLVDPTGTGGNIALDPEYCDGDLGGTIRSSSPCAPAHSPAGCGLIGAFDVGCYAPAAVDPGTVRGPRFAIVPNPARAQATISLENLRTAGPGVITIHDLAGRKLREWRWSETSGAVQWDGRDDSGRLVPSGVYAVEGQIDGVRVAPGRVLWIR